MRRAVGRALGGVVVLAVVAMASSCKGPMAKIEAVRDALERDDAAAVKAATESYPMCADAEPVALGAGQPSPRDKGCFADIAAALGSKKGFNPSPPDQAAAATAAIVLVREGRGDYLAHADNWLASLKNGKGPGPDALRLAVAKRMAEAAPRVGRKLDDDAAARDAMKAIAGAVPGACPTYALLGGGRDPKSLPPELSAEHAACVHKDLARREGPGPSYGEGIFRALEGSLAVWREMERALRLGLANTAEGPKATLENKLKIIEPATQAIASKKIAVASPAAAVTFLGEVHAEAGIILWKDAGGADAATADAGPPPLKRPLP